MFRHRFIFGFALVILLKLTCQVPLEEKSRTRVQQDDAEESVESYFDVDESVSRSNSRPAFEDVIKELQNINRNGELPPPAPTSPPSSSSPVARPGRPPKGKSSPSETPLSKKSSLGLVDFDSDDGDDDLVGLSGIDSAIGPDRSVEPEEKVLETLRSKLVPPPPQPSSTPSEPRPKHFGLTEEKKREMRPSPTAADLVSEGDMRALFINSGFGSSVIIPGCALVHFHIKSRCAGNLIELTLLSRNPLKGQVRLLEGDGQVSMDGTNLVVYGVLGPLSPSGNLWKLTKRVLKSDLEGECYNCDSMNVRVVVKVGDATCGMAVSCQQKTSARLVPVEVVGEYQRTSPPPSVTPTSTSMKDTSPPNPVAGDEPAIQDPGNTAKTTMMLTYGESNSGMAGRPVTGMVALGTRMSLILSVFSRDVTLDLHVVKCQAKGDNGRGLILIKDGCSASSAIGEFKEILGIVQESSFGSHSVRRVSQITEIRAFNFRRSPQNVTLICTIKMCGGECTERPSCVDSDINTMRSTRPAVPIFTQEVTLGKTFYAAGLPPEPTAEMLELMMDSEPRNEQPVLIETYPDNCITRKTLFIILGFLSCFYLGILLLCIYCVRRTTVRAVKEHIMEDYESPPKALYSEYCSPRRRTTPQTSPDHTTYSINTDGYKSPILQRSV